jgi:type I restriction enzyme S subunit
MILGLAFKGKIMRALEEVEHAQEKVIDLGSVMTLEYGKPLDKALRSGTGQIPVYGANGVKTRTEKPLVNKQGIVVGRKGSAGEVNITDGPFWPLDVTFYAKYKEDVFDLQYLYYLLKSLELPKMARGIKPGINRNDVNALKIRSIDLEEQKRVVAKVNELMAICDQIELVLVKQTELAKKIAGSLTSEVAA